MTTKKLSNHRAAGQLRGRYWLRTAGEAERNRLANALTEGNDTPDNFVDAVCQPINPGPATALAVVLSGDDDVVIGDYLESLGVSVDDMNHSEFAKGWIEGVMG